MASREHRFRYDTDLTYTAWCEKETADKERNAQAILRARGILRAPGDHVVLDSRKFRGQRAIVLRQELDTGLCRVRLTDGKEISRISPKHLLVHVAEVRANREPEVGREPRCPDTCGRRLSYFPLMAGVPGISPDGAPRTA